MNGHMIRILMRKDLSLVALPVLGYFLGGVLALGLMTIPQPACFYAGTVLLITTMMALGFHPPMATVVGERKEQTLPFVMSLPVTAVDVTVAKILLNLAVFFIPWTVLLAGCALLVVLQPAIPDGLLPYTLILFGAIAVNAVLNLCMAIASESMQLTIAVQIAGNLVFQAVMYSASKQPPIAATMRGEAVVWSAPVLAYAGVYLAIILLALAAALWRQSRKTSFI